MASEYSPYEPTNLLPQAETKQPTTNQSIFQPTQQPNNEQSDPPLAQPIQPSTTNKPPFDRTHTQVMDCERPKERPKQSLKHKMTMSFNRGEGTNINCIAHLNTGLRDVSSGGVWQCANTKYNSQHLENQLSKSRKVTNAFRGFIHTGLLLLSLIASNQILAPEWISHVLHSN